ncbi:MAG TPA: hypothetical protein P5027_08930 [Flavobacteriales bacterium]|nr:hypothetical protein [Flavobacteriales bacterium]
MPARRTFLLLLSLALFLVTWDVLSLERTCDHPDGGPELYGLPLVWRTSIPWVNSMSGELYLGPLVLNTVCWLVVLLGLHGLLRPFLALPARFARWAVPTLTVLLLLASALTFVAIEWRVEAWSPWSDSACTSRVVFFTPMK